MKRTISAICFLSVLILIPLQVQAATHTDTLSTYYPAPQGQYKNLTVSNNFTINGTGAACSSTAGQVALYFDGSNLDYCSPTSSGPQPFMQSTSNLWNTNPSGYMYPAAGSNEAVVIGGGSPASGSALTVNGSSPGANGAYIQGNVYITGSIMGVSDPLINPNGILNLGRGYTNGTIAWGNFQVWQGSTTLGAGGGNNTTTINGSTTITGNVGISGNTTMTGNSTVTGNVGIGPNETSPQNTLEVNGTTKLCDSTGACASLGTAINCQSGTCYAAYAP